MTFFLPYLDRLLPEPLPEAIAIAVSGGADSMALTLMAAKWAKQHNVALYAFTVDHALRPEAAAEADQVHAWLSARDIPHEILQWQPAEKPSANLQAQAREARYILLVDACKAKNIRYLLLAHHVDDQAETFLIRLQRGSGVDGLSAMRALTEKDGIVLVRPLLAVPKRALVEFLQEEGQPWTEDPSNQAERFTRTRMRQLLPELENVGVTAAVLAATAERMARASDYLHAETAKARESCLILHEEGYITLKLEPFKALHPEIALRLLADSFRLMNHDIYRPRFSELEGLYHALPEARTLAGCRFIPKKGDMLIIRELAAVAPPLVLVPHQPALWDGRFEITLLEDFPATVQALKMPLPDETKKSPLPKAVLHVLPALTALEKPLSIPHMASTEASSIRCRIRHFPMAIGERFR